MISKNLRTFFSIFLVSLVGWWGANLLYQDLEDYFYWQEFMKNPEIFVARVNPRPPKLRIKPEIKKAQQDLEIEAESAIAVLISSKGKQVLFEKNTSQQRPIASLTKLVTALVAEEFYQSDQVFLISKEAISQEEERGMLKVGEELSLNELLHIMLIESSNDAAWAIAEGIIADQEEFLGKERFVELMNSRVEKIGLRNTHFINPTGLDGLENYSTSKDLVKLVNYLIKNHPQILEISQKQSYKVLNPDGSIHHFISENTNKLLGEIPEIIGGKTGYTEEAGGCVLLVLEKDGDYLVNIVLGTASPEARFEEVKKLIDFSYGFLTNL